MTPSEPAAILARPSGSWGSPRSTVTPAASSRFADSSERARPTTSWPAPISSGTTAEPIQPDAPVTKILMADLQGVLMSVTAIKLDIMSVTVNAYHVGMGRWQPDSRGRLQEAALALYSERGFDQTTAAEIAARAGVTERTFYRHFADKREVLFGGSLVLKERILAGGGAAPKGDGPLEAVACGLDAAAGMLGEGRRDLTAQRQAVIAAN